MKQKDYKEIARIIKEEYKNSFSVDRWSNLVYKLADYFERKRIEEDGFFQDLKYKDFNKKQFLKDCGVIKC